MEKPWYKQFWPWFLIILPGTVVVWTIITVIVFTQNSVDLVTEDYYKKGKGINIDLSKVSRAQELGLSAEISQINKQMIITLDQGELNHYPALKVMYAHRTLPDHDFEMLITADVQGNYRFSPDADIAGPWFVELTPHDEQWLLQGRVSFPLEQSIPLTN
ncbi:FixH family protein [Vibrio sp. FNV 38]|nr:FixH family protein [Vibrio sp. FNV 38]